jgi:hypothetical protein
VTRALRFFTAALLAVLVLALKSERVAWGKSGVDVAIAGAEPEASSVETVVRERIEELGMELRATRLGGFDLQVIVRSRPDPTALAHVWIDLTGPDRISVIIADGPATSMLVRQLLRAGASDEVLREAVGHVVASAADALSHGAVIGIAPDRALAEILPRPPPPSIEPPPASAPPPLTKVPPGSSVVLEPGIFYEVVGYAHGELAQGPAIALSVARRAGRWSIGGWLWAQFRLPIAVSGSVGLTLSPAGAFRAMGIAEYALTRTLSLRPAAGLGADVFSESPQAGSASGAALSTGEILADPILSGAMFLLFRLGVGTILMGPVVDASFSPRRYVVDHGGTSQVLLQPWTFRPGLAVGFSR